MAAAQTVNGPNFPVESYTTGDQGVPDVAVDPAGHFVMVWSGEGAGDDNGVHVRRVSSGGRPIGADFQVNTYTTDDQVYPAVAVDANGRFVVVWNSWEVDGEAYGVAARVFNADGTPAGGEFVVNTYTYGWQYNPDVAYNPDGTFVVTWQTDYQDDSAYTAIMARRFDANGAPLAAEFVVNTFTTGNQFKPKVVGNALGFAIAWDGEGLGDTQGVFARLFDPLGNPFPALPGQFRVNTTAANAQRYVSVGASGTTFVVAWEEFIDSLPVGELDVYAKRYVGITPGAQFRVNTNTVDYQLMTNVAVDPTGAFTVSWASYNAGTGYDVMAKMYNAAGTAVTGDFQVNTYTTNYQRFPAVAAGGPGDFVVLWESRSTDVEVGVVGQRYGDLIFSDNVETGSTGFWDFTAPGITVSGAAALESDFGMEVAVSGEGGVFVQDDSPEDENRFRARFYFDPNGHDPGESAGQRRVRLMILFQETPTMRRLAAIVLRRVNGQYALMTRVTLDDDTRAQTVFTNITDGPHWVEIDWQRSTGPDANDGSFAMSIDGTPVTPLSGLDNSLSSVDMVRFGTITNKSAASGVLYVDEYVSRRTNAIGPVN